MRRITAAAFGLAAFIAVDARADSFSQATECHSSVEQGHYEQAIALCAAALEAGTLSEPNIAVTANNLGRARLRLGAFAEAEADFTRAFEADPRYAHPLNNRGVARARLGRLEEALIDFDAALDLDPAYVSALFNRAELRLELGDPYGALQDVAAVIEKQPDLSAALESRSRILARLGLPGAEAATADVRQTEIASADRAEREGVREGVREAVAAPTADQPASAPASSPDAADPAAEADVANEAAVAETPAANVAAEPEAVADHAPEPVAAAVPEEIIAAAPESTIVRAPEPTAVAAAPQEGVEEIVEEAVQAEPEIAAPPAPVAVSAPEAIIAPDPEAAASGTELRASDRSGENTRIVAPAAFGEPALVAAATPDSAPDRSELTLASARSAASVAYLATAPAPAYGAVTEAEPGIDNTRGEAEMLSPVARSAAVAAVREPMLEEPAFEAPTRGAASLAAPSPAGIRVAPVVRPEIALGAAGRRSLTDAIAAESRLSSEALPAIDYAAVLAELGSVAELGAPRLVTMPDEAALPTAVVVQTRLTRPAPMSAVASIAPVDRAPAHAAGIEDFERAFRAGELSVAAAQEALTALGYKPGPVDGIYGRRTRKALAQCLAETCPIALR